MCQFVTGGKVGSVAIAKGIVQPVLRVTSTDPKQMTLYRKNNNFFYPLESPTDKSMHPNPINEQAFCSSTCTEYKSNKDVQYCVCKNGNDS